MIKELNSVVYMLEEVAKELKKANELKAFEIKFVHSNPLRNV